MKFSTFLKMVPNEKKPAIKDFWEDSDGIWVILNEGWNADHMDFPCRTIHCGGEDEATAATIQDLRFQIEGIRKLGMERSA